jgi:uncharacterized protein YjbJ (UPF0337 family)
MFPSDVRRQNMAWDTLKGDWKEVKGKIKEKWGLLTDDDLEVIAGRRDQLIGKLQQFYGSSREDAQRRVDDF